MSLMKPKMPSTPPPKPEEPKIAIPDHSDPKYKSGARNRRRKDDSKRRGRNYTDLTGGSEVYSRTRLG